MNLALDTPRKSWDPERNRRRPPQRYLPWLGGLLGLLVFAACVSETGLDPLSGEISTQNGVQTYYHPFTPGIAPYVDSTPTDDGTPLTGGPIRIVPRQDPIANLARIRGITWPIVANEGASRVYPAQIGLASFYHEDKKVATGEDYNPNGLTAAHLSLPFGTLVRCTRMDNGNYVIVMINDRGPHVPGRIIDLSVGAARVLGMTTDGIIRCRVDVLAYPLIETMGPKGNG